MFSKNLRARTFLAFAFHQRAALFKTQGLNKSALSFGAGVMENLGLSNETTDWRTFQEVRGPVVCLTIYLALDSL